MYGEKTPPHHHTRVHRTLHTSLSVGRTYLHTYLHTYLRTYLRTASMVFAATRLPVMARIPNDPYSSRVVLGMMVSLIPALFGTRT